MSTHIYSAILLLISSQSIFANSCKTFSSSQKNFVETMVEQIRTVNQSLSSQRSEIQRFKGYYEKNKTLSAQYLNIVTRYASDYRVEKFNPEQSSSWQTLLARIDGLPVSFVLAQAIIESAWGTSRFASQASNYFGIWCYSPGCGLVPRQRPEHAHYEVKKYDSMHSSIEHYMHTLNVNLAYQELRQARAEQRSIGRCLDAASLTIGLKQYSQKKQSYINSLKSLISNYCLTRFDTCNEKSDRL